MQTWLEELSTPVCEHLLADALIGRLAVVRDGEPLIFPVNHVVDDRTGSLVFPSNVRTKFHAALAAASVAFEVDGVDPGGASAWSVLVAGKAEDVTGSEIAARAEAHRIPLWAAGPYTHWVRIVPSRITGRRISTIPATRGLPG